MKKYIPYILILAAFFTGRMTGPDNSKQVSERYQAERALILEQLGKKQVEIMRLNEAQLSIERKRKEDSIQFAGALERNQMAYNRLKRKYNEINLNRADAHVLDSLVSGLYPE